MLSTPRLCPTLCTVVLLLVAGPALLGQEASAACVPTGLFEETFDGYPPSTSLHGLGDWKGINNDPFFTAQTRFTTRRTGCVDG